MRLIALVLLFIFSSCEIKVSTDKGEKQSGTTIDKREKRSNTIRNGIIINENGLKVEEAYLTADDGSLLSNENKIDVNDNIKMKLVIRGWKEENDKVFAGASERVLTSEGDTILNEKDLFENFSENISAKDARYITLSVNITKMTKIVDHLLVEFRLWDKKSDAEVWGSYKLYLK